MEPPELRPDGASCYRGVRTTPRTGLQPARFTAATANGQRHFFHNSRDTRSSWMRGQLGMQAGYAEIIDADPFYCLLLIADMLGARRENVTEAAGKLKKAGLIHLQPRPHCGARSPPTGSTRMRVLCDRQA